MLVMVTDTVQKLYSVVLATWTLSELREKDKTFYFFQVFDTCKGQVQDKYDATPYVFKRKYAMIRNIQIMFN